MLLAASTGETGRRGYGSPRTVRGRVGNCGLRVDDRRRRARLCTRSHDSVPIIIKSNHTHTHTHTHTYPFNGPFSGTTRVRAGTRKVKPIWILLKQETVSGSGNNWAICKSAPRSRQITTPAPHRSVFLQAGCPSCRPTNSVKALKANQIKSNYLLKKHITFKCSK